MTLAELRTIAQAGKHADPGWYRVHRRLSIHITRLALRLGLEADHVSALMLAAGTGAALLIAAGSHVANALGFGFGYTAFLLDKVDGEVARSRGTPTMRGILLDRFHHRFVEPGLLFAMAWHEFRLWGSAWVLVAGLAAILFGNAIDELQHLPAYILYKHLRQGGRAPSAAPAPASPGLARARDLARPLKTARTVALSLPLAALAYAAEALGQRPVPSWFLALGAVALAIHVAFQCFDYWVEGLECETRSVAAVMRDRFSNDLPEPSSEARREGSGRGGNEG